MVTDIISSVAMGFGPLLTFDNLLYCFIGVFLGTLIGVLPGVGPVPTMSILLPLTFGLPPLGALIMLAGVYYGAQYGGSTTAILVNLPGEVSSVITCLDGHAMAKQGRAGAALATAAIGSFIAGTIATIIIAVAAPILGSFAAQFTPADYVSLIVLGLLGAIALARGSAIDAMSATLLGITLGFVGTDITSGVSRISFGFIELADGLSIAALAIGLFGISEILSNLEGPMSRDTNSAPVGKIMPPIRELLSTIPAMLRGTFIGSALGVLPGGGAALAAYGSYATEKKLSRHPERFGQGAIEGVAGPEAANNAAAQTSFIPMLTLGVPTNAIMALMVGAMTIQGVTPGPQIMTQQPALFWGLIASMWIGNLMLLVINLPLIGIWISLLRVPYRILFPTILVFCCVGVYGVNNNIFDIYVAIIFACAGYFFRKIGFEPAPLMLGFVLGPQLEENFRRALVMSRGDFSVFVTEPVSLFFLIVAVILIGLLLFPAFRAKREVVFEED